MATETNSHWYQQPIMWLVVAVPLAAVILGIVMISLALTSDDGLVVDDYYKKGLEINRSLERDEFAAQLGLRARIDLNEVEGRVIVDLHWPVAADPPQAPVLSFLHATRKERDRELVLHGDGRGRYQADLPALGQGRWYIRLATQRWRLQKVVSLPLRDELLLVPNTTATNK